MAVVWLTAVWLTVVWLTAMWWTDQQLNANYMTAPERERERAVARRKGMMKP